MNDSANASERTESGPRHTILINGEEQYSLWQKDREIPKGWKEVQIPADWEEKYWKDHPEATSKELCLAYIGEVWTDMRPLSLRRATEERTAS